MPTLPAQSLELEPNAIRVLITGFGPFSIYRNSVNPSWLAVRPLHNTILYTQSPTLPVTHNDQTMELKPPANSQQIHITTLEIPTSYDAVLSQIPGLHASPPVLPASTDSAFATPPPPEKGYDFVMHVGVAGRGPLALEKQGHKLGYDKPDVDGKYAPEVALPDYEASRTPSEAERFERERLGLTESDVPAKHTRGFAEGYESFAEELFTQIEVDKLLHHLQESDLQVRASTDAGRYLCDFIYYCSLAESQRQAVDGKKPTPVFFLHCCPVDQPYSTEAVTDVIKRIVSWVGPRLK